ncbi:DUF3572 family protein [Rhodobacteraceae bacterium 2CG4]|uniref:DUF3572 family protein n=2 Tax=Halovulum marinum TaxID=2662447 RepID=A0A6L5YWR2_9RHOB|nr:DUF3572 family protein [Halovulum marinum]
MTMSEDRAEAIALAALGWIAAEPERAGAFLGASGAAPDELRQRAGDPMFLGFVLDFLLQDDGGVQDFAAQMPCHPEEVLRARAALPGGDLPNWT